MKTDLATTIGIAIVGVLIAFFVCNYFIGSIAPISFRTVETDVDADLAEPDVNVFN